MKKQISSRDWETLSVYLDGQVRPRARTSLEARLQTDPSLSAALDELRRTRSVLRSLPRLRAPRNFTLTPQMAGQPRVIASRLYPAFRLASALASLLFVLVVAGDFLGLGGMATAPLKEAAAPQIEFAIQEAEALPAMEAVEMPVAAEAGDKTAEPPAPAELALEAEITEVAEADIIPRVGGAENDVDAGVIEKEGAAEAAEAMSLDYEAGSVGEEEAAASTQQPLPSDTPDDREEAASMDALAEPQVEMSKSEAVTKSHVQTPVVAPEIPSDRSRETSEVWPLVRYVEVFLGIAAIGAGVAAFYLRRRGWA
ncbi:MAG: hypothetical protein KKD28_03985 [Chloroflexi bacterium]|nr:hypothetical protein [Chloroflexota bacterium]